MIENITGEISNQVGNLLWFGARHVMVAGMANLSIAPPVFHAGTKAVKYYNYWLQKASATLESKLHALKQAHPDAHILFVPVVQPEAQK